METQLPQIFIQEYKYDLPQHRIAEFPLPERDGSKLLIYANGVIKDDFFYSLPAHISGESTLILNNTRVIEARILFKKPTGGIIEIFCLEPYNQSIEEALDKKGNILWKCLIGGASKWKPGQILQKECTINGAAVTLTTTYLERLEDNFLLQFSWAPEYISFADILHDAGAVPLPPYIKRTAQQSDAERYQTIFAKHRGSVAAPTAALHFTDTTFDALKQKDINIHYVTLHVGAGTFKPVKAKTIDQHVMHAEHFTVSASTLRSLIAAKKVVAVGTTSLRTLESLYWLGIKLLQDPALSLTDITLTQWEAYDLQKHAVPYEESLQALVDKLQSLNQAYLFCQTSLLIAPGYKFQIPDGLITNFHQPQSTLLLLISAFIGEDWKKVYNHALKQDYRFLSYGDSSLLWRKAD